MRSVWSGNLAFGLVSIPVKLGSAVSSHKIAFRQIHLADHGRVRYQKTCELDEEVLSASDIGRAYETPDDQLVEITDDDLRALPLPTAKTIEVNGFVDIAAVDSMQLDTPYFVAPSSPAADKPYVLMREALARSGKAAVGKFAMRNSEHLALITPRDEVLVLQTLRWPDELNPASDAVPKGSVNVSENELRLADTLIDALGEADLSAYQDEYGQAVEALVTAKLEGAELPAAGEEGRGGKVVDLMAALRASVEAAKGRGGEAREEAGQAAEGDEAAEGATVTHLKQASRKTAAEQGAGQAPRKKAAAKKQPAASKRAAGKEAASGTASGTAKKTAQQSARKAPAKKAAQKKTASKRRAG
ncbi:Ku protein [Streptomyces sp. HPF1205]|uniref:non-homologous end joining protein Ku n=1 Tax=Streptomyces sp. HPF1205 TaxID=2873262 RepID=UPI001CECF246|nr:Ku protein [Streptomyces sp. HPF1205]